MFFALEICRLTISTYAKNFLNLEAQLFAKEFSLNYKKLRMAYLFFEKKYLKTLSSGESPALVCQKMAKNRMIFILNDRGRGVNFVCESLRKQQGEPEQNKITPVKCTTTIQYRKNKIVITLFQSAKNFLPKKKICWIILLNPKNLQLFSQTSKFSIAEYILKSNFVKEKGNKTQQTKTLVDTTTI